MELLNLLGPWIGGLAGLAAAFFVFYTAPAKRSKIEEEAAKAAAEAAKAAAEAELTAITGFKALIESQIEAHGAELQRMSRRYEQTERELAECKERGEVLEEKIEKLEHTLGQLVERLETNPALGAEGD